jgi:hypothetical protein
MQNVDVKQDARLAALTGTAYTPSATLSTVSSGGGPANRPPSGNPFKVSPSLAGLIAETDGDAYPNGRSTARASINREVIEGVEREVINMEVTLNRGFADPYAMINMQGNSVVENLRNATGIRFKVYGDGKPWILEFSTSEARSDYAFYLFQFNTRRNRVIEIDVPYSGLKQPSSGKKVFFNRKSIYQLQFSRKEELGLGRSSIKVFDLEIY